MGLWDGPNDVDLRCVAIEGYKLRIDIVLQNPIVLERKATGIVYYNMDTEDIMDRGETLRMLTVEEITSVLSVNEVPVPRDRQRPKAALVEHAIKVAPSDVLEELLRQAANKRKRRADDEKPRREQKRARQEADDESGRGNGWHARGRG